MSNALKRNSKVFASLSSTFDGDTTTTTTTTTTSPPSTSTSTASETRESTEISDACQDFWAILVASDEKLFKEYAPLMDLYLRLLTSTLYIRMSTCMAIYRALLRLWYFYTYSHLEGVFFWDGLAATALAMCISKIFRGRWLGGSLTGSDLFPKSRTMVDAPDYELMTCALRYATLGHGLPLQSAKRLEMLTQSARYTTMLTDLKRKTRVGEYRGCVTFKAIAQKIACIVTMCVVCETVFLATMIVWCVVSRDMSDRLDSVVFKQVALFNYLELGGAVRLVTWPMAHFAGYTAVGIFMLGLVTLSSSMEMLMYKFEVAKATENAKGELESLTLSKEQAFNEYLYIQSMFHSVSVEWSFVVGLGLTLSFCLIMISVILIYLGGKALTTGLFALWMGILISGFVLMFLIAVIPAYINGKCSDFQRVFNYSAPHQLERIGGRALWLQFMVENPIYYYIYGFPITKSWIVGFIYGIGSATTLAIAARFSGAEEL